MSVQDIVKYVRQTPGNTNPSVIASMVESEIRQNSSNSNVKSDWAENDPENPSYIKNRTHYESGFSFDFDGVLEGKEYYDISELMPGLTLVKVSDKPFLEEDLIGAKVTVMAMGNKTLDNAEITNENIVYYDEEVDSIIMGAMNETPLFISIKESFEGLPPIGFYLIYYVISEGVTLYTSNVNNLEVIRLEEKYLPTNLLVINEIPFNFPDASNSVMLDSRSSIHLTDEFTNQLNKGIVKVKLKYRRYYNDEEVKEDITYLYKSRDGIAYGFLNNGKEVILVEVVNNEISLITLKSNYNPYTREYSRGLYHSLVLKESDNGSVNRYYISIINGQVVATKIEE